MTDTIIAYGITADAQDWRDSGLTTTISELYFSGTTDVVPGERRISLCHGAEKYLFLARADGLDGAHALAFAVRARDAVAEEKSRVTAQAREADAISELAAALSTDMDRGALDRILPHLSERTQYAVRQQLRGRGI